MTNSGGARHKMFVPVEDIIKVARVFCQAVFALGQDLMWNIAFSPSFISLIIESTLKEIIGINGLV